MIHVSIYNLSVALQTDESKLIDLIEKFITAFYTVKGQSFNASIEATDKRFVSKLSIQGVYYFHVNQFRHLLYFLKQYEYKIDHAVTEDKRKYETVEENYKVREGWNLRDEQIAPSKFITDKPTGSKMINLQTGAGKTFLALYSLAKVNMRIAVVILPTYIDKWVMDIATIHDTTVKDVMVIQGSKSLKGLITMAKEGTIASKYFIFSSRTLQEYISSYELNPQESVDIYGIHPIDLFPLLNVGSLLVDETHQHFHAIYKILLHSNVKLQVGLSATLMSDDSVVSNVHRVVYPDKTIYDAGGLVKYADVYALSYSIPPDFLRSIKTSNYGSKSYSHAAFEQSVTRFPPMLKFFCSLIDNTLKDFYIDKYEEKDKCMIFVATVKLATILTQRYEKMYPDKIVKRYCQEDPFDHIKEGEIIVTTVISAGTAIDIPDLRTVIQTVSISSTVSNIQTLGRLRKLSNDRDARFCYVYAENLVKQRQYHYKRIELFRERVASHRFFKARVSY